MADSLSHSKQEDSVRCPICLGKLKTPRQLLCMHTYCENCLQNHISSQASQLKDLRAFKCPTCGCNNSPPVDMLGDKPINIWASLFPLNTILSSMIGSAKVNVYLPCHACHSGGISSTSCGFCMVCEEAMCESCLAVHRRQKMSRDHKIISMEEFTGNPHDVVKYTKGFSCPEHDGVTIDFYCKDHNTACCGKCCIVSHRNCANVSDLKKELPSLLREMNPESIIEHMKKAESHLKKFIEVSESNIHLLRSQVTGLTKQIRKMKKKMNDAFDELEKNIKREGENIIKEELLRKQQLDQQCQSLIYSIRNSNIVLETVRNCGTKAQLFFVTEKLTLQLRLYRDLILKNYLKTQTTKVQLEVDVNLKSILSSQAKHLAKMLNQQVCHTLPLSDIRIPVQFVRSVDVKSNYEGDLECGAVCYLSSSNMMMLDRENKRVSLLDTSYNSIASYIMPEKPYGICVVGDEVAVTMLNQAVVQFLEVKDGKIRPTRTVSTSYLCDSVAEAGQGKIVVSGDCGDGGKHYWSLYNANGREESCHQFECKCNRSATYVALNKSYTRVLVTVRNAHSLYCFDFNGRQIFVYNTGELNVPQGVATDMHDTVYVIGGDSNNIHHLTTDGIVLQIIYEGVPINPKSICFNKAGVKFVVASDSQKSKLHLFRLQ